MGTPRSLPRSALFASLFLSSSAAFAQGTPSNIVRLDMEGLTVLSGGTRDDVAIADFYNGGSSRVPGSTAVVVTGPSPRAGVVFSPNALATETQEGGNGGQSTVFGLARDLYLENGTVLQSSTLLGTAALVSGGMDFISLAYEFGFNNGLSFFYNSDTDLRISVFSNTGTLLASEDLRLSGSGSGSCSPGATGTRCSWVAASVPFLGTAYGVIISGLSGDFSLDNITLGMLDPLAAITPPVTPPGPPVVPVIPPVVPPTPTPVTPIPEPGTYGMMALGVAAVAFAARRRRPVAAPQAAGA